MDDLVGGTICNGCGYDRAYAPGIGYFCRNDACTYEKEQAKAMLRQMRPVDPRDARIQALETSLAEAEGRVKKMERALGNIRALATKHQAVCGPDGNWAHVEGFAATALETGEWKK